MKQQSKGIKHTHQYQDEEQKRIVITGIDKFWMYSYWNQQITGQRKKIKMELMNRSFKVFNADRTKDREVT